MCKESNRRRWRLFAADIDTPVRIDGAEAHHALHVLRLGKGAEVELFDGAGNVADGRIIEVGRGEIVISVERRWSDQRRGTDIRVAFALPKPSRLNWMLEKATELAAVSLQPVSFERSMNDPNVAGESKRRRWAGSCVSAAKQSGLNFLPELNAPVTLADFLKAASRSDALNIIGDAAPNARTLPQVLAGRRSDQGIRLMVGPEGGITDEERGAICEAGFAPVRIGWTTLRVETAAVALLSAVRAICD